MLEAQRFGLITGPNVVLAHRCSKNTNILLEWIVEEFSEKMDISIPQAMCGFSESSLIVMMLMINNKIGITGVNF